MITKKYQYKNNKTHKKKIFLSGGSTSPPSHPPDSLPPSFLLFMRRKKEQQPPAGRRPSAGKKQSPEGKKPSARRLPAGIASADRQSSPRAADRQSSPRAADRQTSPRASADGQPSPRGKSGESSGTTPLLRRTARTARTRPSAARSPGSTRRKTTEERIEELEEIFKKKENLLEQTFLNFEISKGIIGDVIKGYRIPSFVMSSQVNEGYLVKINCNTKKIGIESFYIHIDITDRDSGDLISYIDDVIAETIRDKNGLIIPEYTIKIIEGDKVRSLKSLNIQKRERISILERINLEPEGATITIKSFDDLVNDITSTLKLQKFKIQCYLSYCSFKFNKALPVEKSDIFLESFGFYTLDELKSSFREKLKSDGLPFVGLRFAAICNLIVKGVLNGQHFRLADDFSSLGVDPIRSFTLNEMGLNCSRIFCSEMYDSELTVQIKESKSSSFKTDVTIQPFKDFKEIELKIELKIKLIELLPTKQDLIDQIKIIISSFFNDTESLRLMISYLNNPKPDNINFVKYYDKILCALQNIQEDIVTKIFTKILREHREVPNPKKLTPAELSKFESRKRLNEDAAIENFRNNLSYFLKMMCRISNNALGKGLNQEHFCQKILKLMTGQGYYSILAESEEVEGNQLYYFNELG